MPRGVRRGEALAEAAVLYQQGLNTAEIAAQLDVSPQTVLRRLRAAGLRIRGPRDWAAKLMKPMDLRVQEMATQGHTVREIAEELGEQEEALRRRMVRRGIPRQEAKPRPEHNHFWQGGRTVDERGYVLIHRPDHPYATEAGYVREHRLVMEAQLGRYLLPTEVVDHIDGVTDHNDPSNLRVFASNADHLRATLTGRRRSTPQPPIQPALPTPPVSGSGAAPSP
jgi:DNA-binding CsgD family transcriptional regulator